MNKTIYLDWNVFQDIFQKRKNLELEERLKDLRNNGYKIVYSGAHMQDLCKCSNEEYIEKDLSLLADLTENCCLGFINETIAIEKIDTKTVFKSIKKSVELDKISLDDININFYFNPYLVDRNKLSSNNIILPFLENGYMTPETMKNFIHYLISEDIFRNHSIQKQFRSSLQECAKINNPAFKQMLNMPMFKFLLSSKEDIMNNFPEIVNSFLSISNKSLDSITLGEKITTSYRILDYFYEFSERLDRRNTQQNISIDSEHLLFASNSKYLICGDEKMCEKAKIIYQLCGIKTRVLTPDEFIRKIHII